MSVQVLCFVCKTYFSMQFIVVRIVVVIYIYKKKILHIQLVFSFLSHFGFILFHSINSLICSAGYNNFTLDRTIND